MISRERKWRYTSGVSIEEGARFELLAAVASGWHRQARRATASVNKQRWTWQRSRRGRCRSPWRSLSPLVSWPVGRLTGWGGSSWTGGRNGYRRSCPRRRRRSTFPEEAAPPQYLSAPPETRERESVLAASLLKSVKKNNIWDRVWGHGGHTCQSSLLQSSFGYYVCRETSFCGHMAWSNEKQVHILWKQTVMELVNTIENETCRFFFTCFCCLVCHFKVWYWTYCEKRHTFLNWIVKGYPVIIVCSSWKNILANVFCTI